MKEPTKIYMEIIRKRLERKKAQLAEVEKAINSEGVATSIEKRKFIELKAVVLELENIIDITESMFDEKNKE